MNHNEIVQLVDRFLDPKCGLPELTRLLGRVKDDSSPRAIRLEEKFDDLLPIELLRMSPGLPSAGFITTIILRFKKPFRIDMAKLGAIYGPAEELPMDPSPKSDRSIGFEITSKPMRGSLAMTVSRDKRDPLIREILIQRDPPDWK